VDIPFLKPYCSVHFEVSPLDISVGDLLYFRSQPLDGVHVRDEFGQEQDKMQTSVHVCNSNYSEYLVAVVTKYN
jgi:hypothetical protein